MTQAAEKWLMAQMKAYSIPMKNWGLIWEKGHSYNIFAKSCMLNLPSTGGLPLFHMEIHKVKLWERLTIMVFTEPFNVSPSGQGRLAKSKNAVMGCFDFSSHPRMF